MKLLLLALLVLSATAQEPAENMDYFLGTMDLPNEKFIDENDQVLFKWLNGELAVVMEITAPSQGFTSIGFSPEGILKDSDILLAYFDKEGFPFLLDMYVDAEGQLDINFSQDAVLVGALQNETHQSFRFIRNWNTFQNGGRDLLSDEPMHIMWALSDDSPYVDDQDKFQMAYHYDKRGRQPFSFRN